MEQRTSYLGFYDANAALPGTKEGSDIRSVYLMLAHGRRLTSLDAVKANHTVCLPKYISLLRNKYNIFIYDEWIRISKTKRVKQYFFLER